MMSSLLLAAAVLVVLPMWSGAAIVATVAAEADKKTTNAAALSLSTFLADHMILQREPQSAQLYGNASAGATINVLLDGKQVATAAASTNGSWVAQMPPQPAGLNHTVTVRAAAHSGVPTSLASVTLVDVGFGDVYLCTGQSNMEFSVNAALNASAEIADSINYPQLRLATVLNRPTATPQSNVPSIANFSWPTDGNRTAGYVWRQSGPNALAPANDTGFTFFSAVCYFTGRDLVRANPDVPVGLLASYIGGVKIETMMSPRALSDATCGGTAYGGGTHVAQGASTAHSYSTEDGNPIYPTGGPLWNGMIYPLLPMRFTAVLFYQGESNSLAGCPGAYSCLFPALIRDWRRAFGNDDLGFFFVQLASYAWHDYTHLRQAQLAALQLPTVGFATAIDLGDMHSPHGGIHPRLKQEVGRRLSLAIRAIQHLEGSGSGSGGTVVQHEGPRLEGVVLTNRQATAATLTFAVSTAQSLHLSGTSECVDCCAQPPSKPWYWAFQVQAPNGSWVGVPARVHRNTVLLSSPVPISGVQYAWGGAPDCALYNGKGGFDNHTGIAAPPFRRCLWGTVAGLPPWNWLSDCNLSPQSQLEPNTMYGDAMVVPSASLQDFIVSSMHVVTVTPDGRSSGTALRSALNNDQGGATFTSRYAIGCRGGNASNVLQVDSVDLSIRYRATPQNMSLNVSAAVLKISLVNADNRPVAVVTPALALGNYSQPSGFSQPIQIHAKGLHASCDAGLGANPHGSLRLLFQITNNHRPVVIPLDDQAAGFGVQVGWANQS